MTVREELQITWKHISSILQPNNKRFEDVPCEWLSFDDFYKANYHKYYRAKRKWKNYKKVTIIKNYKKKAKYKKRTVVFIRKIKELGFTKKNTVFSSPSDIMKYHKPAHLYMFDKKQLLGTRDIKNILKKKGINKTLAWIVTTKKQNKDIFKANKLAQWLWKGKRMSLKDIAIKEIIDKELLSNKIYGSKFDLIKAVEYCKQYDPSKYSFEEKMLYPHEIFKILSLRHNINETTLRSRFYKNNCDYTNIIYTKSKNKYAPYPKKLLAIKGNKEIEFESITDASIKLKISKTAVSMYLNGKLKNTNRTKGYVLKFIKTY
jgi:hypothetical protein